MHRVGICRLLRFQPCLNKKLIWIPLLVLEPERTNALPHESIGRVHSLVVLQMFLEFGKCMFQDQRLLNVVRHRLITFFLVPLHEGIPCLELVVPVSSAREAFRLQQRTQSSKVSCTDVRLVLLHQFSPDFQSIPRLLVAHVEF